MALEGTFSDFHIADIMQLIGLQRKTGTLTLEAGDETLTLIFHDGAVVWAQSTHAPWERRMAHLLVAQGLVTPVQIQDALNTQKSSKMTLRAILMEKGILQQEDWDSVLAREVEEAVYRPFRWTAGRYRFVSQASVDLAEGRIGPLASEQVLMEGIRRADEWPKILDKVPTAGMVFKVRSQVGKFSPKQIEPGEVHMLNLVDGNQTVQELVDSSSLGEFEAMRSLALLVAAGAITSDGPIPAAIPSAAPAPPAPTHVPVRLLALPPTWVARLAWGLAACWLLVALVVFRMEPFGVLPLSATRAASLNRIRSIRAQTDLMELARDADMFAARTGEYPSSLEALDVGERPFRDPWGHPYQIRRRGSGVSLTSGGPDGRFGTPDDLTVDD